MWHTLQTILLDHLRLSLMHQLTSGGASFHVTLFVIPLVAYLFYHWEHKSMDKWIYHSFMGLTHRKYAIHIEGRHITALNTYWRRPIILSNTFTKNFLSMLHFVVYQVKSNPQIYEITEFGSSMLQQSDDKIDTLFIVSQSIPFLIDQEKEIYCVVDRTAEDDNDTKQHKSCKIVKYKITLFSYRCTLAVMKQYLASIDAFHQQQMEMAKKGQLSVYFLQDIHIENEEPHSTVGGWTEQVHDTMKRFDNIFFEDKLSAEELKCILENNDK
jgi:hypothetical protein